MKTNKYILLIALSVTLSFLLSARFYQKNVTTMQAQAEELFVATLTSELHKKVVEENLPYSYPFREFHSIFAANIFKYISYYEVSTTSL